MLFFPSRESINVCVERLSDRCMNADGCMRLEWPILRARYERFINLCIIIIIIIIKHKIFQDMPHNYSSEFVHDKGKTMAAHSRNASYAKL